MYITVYIYIYTQYTQGPPTTFPLSELDYQTACSLDPGQTLISYVCKQNGMHSICVTYPVQCLEPGLYCNASARDGIR